MKLRNPYILLSAVLAGIAITSCIKKPEYPSEPVIAYENFIRYGNDPSDPDSVEIVVSFTDNEGDIGLGQGDTSGVFKYGNIYATYHYWDTTGTPHWSTFDDLSTPQPDSIYFSYRIPPILPEGDPDEPVKGYIYVKQKPFLKDIGHTKIMYKVYMYDLAKHRSNTVETPALDF